MRSYVAKLADDVVKVADDAHPACLNVINGDSEVFFGSPRVRRDQVPWLGSYY